MILFVKCINYMQVTTIFLSTVFQDREIVTWDMLLDSIILNKILPKWKTEQN